MKCLILFLLASFLSLVCISNTHAQSVKGITNKPYTSFTTYSSFQKLKKDFPGILIVHEFDFPAVIQKKSIVYCKTSSYKLLMDAFYCSIRGLNQRFLTLILF